MHDIHAEQSHWSHAIGYRSTSRVRTDAVMTSDHTALQMRSSGLSRAGICHSSCKGVARRAKRSLRFVVHAAGRQHSMVFNGRSVFVVVVVVESTQTPEDDPQKR